MAILEQLGLTQDHYDRIADMKADPASFGITSQYDYAKKSGKDAVSRSAPGLGVISAFGQTVASPVYDYGQALNEFSKKGYEGEFSFTPQGVVDFAKNVGSVGKEFLDQKPFTMAGGRFMGGLEALGERYGILDPYADIKGQTAMMPLGTIISGAKGIFGGKGGAAIMKKMGKDLAMQKAAEKIARQQIEKELAERALRAQRERARAMGFRGSTRSDDAQSFADTQTYGGGGTRGDMGADTFI